MAGNQCQGHTVTVGKYEHLPQVTISDGFYPQTHIRTFIKRERLFVKFFHNLSNLQTHIVHPTNCFFPIFTFTNVKRLGH